MIDRIKRIIEEKGLQASSFADKIQVSRGTISHLLNGRNDPSKDTIDKILKNFPDISSSWFLRGEEPMYIREPLIVHQSTSTSSPVQSDLFEEKKTVEQSEKLPGPEYLQKKEVKKSESRIELPAIKDINLSNISAKKIDKIMIFFSDKTFMTFIPED